MKVASLYLFKAVALILLLQLGSCSKQESFQLNETFHISYKGSDMPAYVHGNSSTKTFLLVLHGAGSFGLSFRDGAFKDKLEKDYAVIYFDQRGQSMSQGKFDKVDDIISLMAEDLAILSSVIKKRYGQDISLFILGHSLGGMISATSLINHDQDQYQGWINLDGLMDTPSVNEERINLITEIAKAQIQKATSLEQEWTQLLSDITDQEEYDKVLKIAARTIKLLENDKAVNKIKSSSKIRQAVFVNNPIHWIVSNILNQPAQSAIENNFSLLNRMNEIHIPSLWIYGKYDVSVPPALGQKAFELLNSEEKEFYLFERSIHHPHDTEAELFYEVLYEFIERHR